jgi:hypothetical protein
MATPRDVKKAREEMGLLSVEKLGIQHRAPSSEDGSNVSFSGFIGWILIATSTLIFLGAVLFLITCCPGGCSGVPLAFVVFPGLPMLCLGAILVGPKKQS